jgi:hypothetical protein
MINHNVKKFKDQGYCVIKSAISAELRDFITQYALFDEMQGFSSEKDSAINGAQVPNAHSKYADPAMESLLLILQEQIENNTGLKVFPTYSYFRVYRNGDSLKNHRDRESCEISATLCFNYSYTDYAWPIYMEDKAITLDPGDLVIYKGCDLYHHREEFQPTEESWQVQGFFHYVNQDGPYSDFKFDKRPNIGEPLWSKNIKSDRYITSYVEPVVSKSYIEVTYDR